MGLALSPSRYYYHIILLGKKNHCHYLVDFLAVQFLHWCTIIHLIVQFCFIIYIFFNLEILSTLKIGMLMILLSYFPSASPVKRKRGRPKGSKKKTCLDLAEGKTDSTQSPEDTVQEEEGNKKEGSKQCSLKEGSTAAFCRFLIII